MGRHFALCGQQRRRWNATGREGAYSSSKGFTRGRELGHEREAYWRGNNTGWILFPVARSQCPGVGTALTLD